MSNILTNNISPRSGNVINIGGINDKVSIAGTLSYEDVTNIDSVGVVTARGGLNVVGGGITAVGVITSYSGLNVVGGGISAVGIITAQSGVEFGTVGSGVTIDAVGTGTSLGFLVNGSERVRVDSSGKLLVGTSSSRGGWWNTTGIDSVVQAEATNQWCFSAVNNSANTNGPWINIGKSRGATVGSTTVVQSSDQLGGISFQGADGSKLVPAAAIQGFVDGTPGANDMPGRLVFTTTADGASSPTERMSIDSVGRFNCQGIYDNTSAVSSNVTVNSNGRLQRATSSAKYKTNIETLEDSYADAVLGCRPVWYRSTTGNDNPEHGYWGFIAEEVAAIDPRLVHWKTFEVTHDENGSAVEAPCDPEPEGVQYDRFVPHLLNLIKRQKEQIETLETRLTALEGGAS